MTTKRKEADTKAEDKKTSAPAGKKLILYEAVKANTTPEYIIIGALSLAGLLKQYREEEQLYGVEDLKPSITANELDKIIKNFIGD